MPHDDDGEYFAPQTSLEAIMSDPNSTYRQKLEGLRDYVSHELEANRCKTCFNSKLRTGDTAALVLRLRSLLEDIEGLADPNEEEDEFDAIVKREAHWTPASSDFPPPSDGGFEPGA